MSICIYTMSINYYASLDPWPPLSIPRETRREKGPEQRRKAMVFTRRVTAFPNGGSSHWWLALSRRPFSPILHQLQHLKL